MRIPKYLDEYDFRARFVPALIVSLPIILAFVALFPPAREWRGLVIDPTLEAVMVLLLVRVARDEGERIEPAMVARWDGLPTTRFLRHGNSEIESATRDRYKPALARLVGITFPSAREEAADPVAADFTLHIGRRWAPRAAAREGLWARFPGKLQLRNDPEPGGVASHWVCCGRSLGDCNRRRALLPAGDDLS